MNKRRVWSLVVVMVLGIAGARHLHAVQVLPGLLGNDLTDIGDDGDVLAYVDETETGGFDAVFFSSDEPGFEGGEFAFNVFDNLLGGGNEKWCCGTMFPQTVGADLGMPHVLTHFTVASANDTPERDPRVWTLEGSNDGATWTVIFAQNDPEAGLWTERDQVLLFESGVDYDAPEAYSMFRMVTEATGLVEGAFFQLAEIELFSGELVVDTCPAGATCNGGAEGFTPGLVDGALRLAQDGVGNIASSIIWNEPLDVTGGTLTATFDVAMSAAGTPADGLVFAILDAAALDSTAVGAAGGAMGYEGIVGNSLGVEIDLWQGDAAVDPSGYNNTGYGHVSVLEQGTTVPTQTNVDLDPNLIPTTVDGTGWPALVNLAEAGGGSYSLEIHYTPGAPSHVTVWLTAPEAAGEPAFDRVMVLDTDVDTTIESALVGFTAGTGGAFVTIDVTNFAFEVGVEGGGCPEGATCNDASGAFTPQLVGDALRMSEDGIGNIAASALWNEPFDLAGGTLRASFDVQMSAAGTPADGLVFAILDAAEYDSTAVGGGGGGMGYAGLTGNTLGVEVDLWQGDVANDPSGYNNTGYGHMSVLLPGVETPIQTNVDLDPGTVPVSAGGNGWPALVDLAGAGGGSFSVEIEYTPGAPGHVTVALSAPEALGEPAFDNVVVLDTDVDVNIESAIVGFTAATGGAFVTTDITNWVFEVVGGGEPKTEVYINAGGPEIVDALGRVWTADTIENPSPYLTSENLNVATNANPADVTIDPFVVAQQFPAEVFPVERWADADIVYTIDDLAPGDYQVALLFNEGCCSDACEDIADPAMSAGACRVFDIVINGEVVADQFSQNVLASQLSGNAPGVTSNDIAVTQVFEVSTADGLIEITIDDLGAGNPPENASIKGICIVPSVVGGALGQLPGDTDQDAAVALNDAGTILSNQFLGEPATLACPAGSDNNGDGVVDLSDAVYILEYLFLSGEAPALGTECMTIPDCPEVCE